MKPRDEGKQHFLGCPKTLPSRRALALLAAVEAVALALLAFPTHTPTAVQPQLHAHSLHEGQHVSGSGGARTHCPAQPLSTTPPFSLVSHSRSTLWCTKAAGNVSRRACLVENICHEADTGRWVIYAGDGAADSCLRVTAAGADSELMCDGQDFAHLAPLAYPSNVLRIGVKAGPPPGLTAPDVTWYTLAPSATNPGGTVGLLQARHRPDNYFHSVCDDAFAAWWMLRYSLRHPAAAAAGEPARCHSYADNGGAGPTVLHVLADAFPLGEPSDALLPRLLFPGVFTPAPLRIPLAVSDGKTAITPPAQTVCFQRLAVGSPSLSMHVNAGYSYDEARTWERPLHASASAHAADVRAFAALLTARALATLPDDPAFTPPALRDTIVVLLRTTNRMFVDDEGVVAAVKAAAAAAVAAGAGPTGAPPGTPYSIEVTTFDAPHREGPIAALMQRTALLVGAHGAGLTNLLFMPSTGFPSSSSSSTFTPGVLQIIPSSNPEAAHAFATLAHALRLRHYSLGAACEHSDLFTPLNVDAKALRAAVELALIDGSLAAAETRA